MLRVVLILFLGCFSFVFSELYNSSDHLVLLNNKNFEETVLGSKNGWIIEFYNSWCGHCIHYAPKWKEFSKEVQDWEHTFKVGVIDCSEEENVAVCRDYEIMGYPSVKLFGALTKKGDLGVSVPVKGVKEMQESIIDFIIDKEIKKLGSNSWINVLNYNGLLQDIFKNISPTVKHSVIIVEKPGAKLGSHTILDLGKYSEVYIRRMESTAKEISDLKLSLFPSVVIIDRKGNKQIINQEITTREELTALIIEKLKLLKSIVKVNTVQKKGGSRVNHSFEKDGIGAGDGKLEEINSERLNYDDDLPDTAFNHEEIQVYMVDIENAISYALTHEVALHKVIAGERMHAVRDFLKVLIDYLPTRPQVHNYLVKLNNYLLKSGETLAISEYERALRFVTSSSSVLPDLQSWKGCQGSKSDFRGFPCGMWTLFHAITVNAVLKQEEGTPSYKKTDTLAAIHGYVKHFFSCETCSKNFQIMYISNSITARDADDEIIWLWTAHNKVNKRLKGTLSEDPKHPKVQFPPKQVCSSCWHKEGFMNKKEALKYLKKIYGRGSISLEGVQTIDQVNPNRQVQVFDAISQNFLHRNKVDNLSKSEYKTPVERANWVYNSTDVSLCVILYACSTLIIAAGYMIFLLKRRLRRKKFIDVYKRP